MSSELDRIRKYGAVPFFKVGKSWFVMATGKQRGKPTKKELLNLKSLKKFNEYDI